MRSLSFPKLVIARNFNHRTSEPADDYKTPYPGAMALTHSRESSGASETSSPVTPTFSSRGHSRYPSSTSSLSSTPSSHESVDSPTNLAKPPQPPLDDLVEDPLEREGEYDFCNNASQRPACLCDAQCAHVSLVTARSTSVCPSMPDYDFIDGFFGDEDFTSQSTMQRRRSGDSPMVNLTSRFGGRFPTLSRHFSHRTSASASPKKSPRSAPPSRVPSLRMPSHSRSGAHRSDSRENIVSLTPARNLREEQEQAQISSRPMPSEIGLPTVEDPIDRQALASTPLLPPLMMNTKQAHQEAIQSPLQSPTIAEAGCTFSVANTPMLSPQIPGHLTPPLSSQPSVASFGITRSTHLVASSEIPAMTISEQNDEWSVKLGHANFIISPEPYMPETCDLAARKRLVADWETARFEYMKHAGRTSEHFGSTSQIFKFTEQKWAITDAQWKRNHELVVAQAAANGEDPVYQPLAEQAPLVKMPSLNDPQNRGKFPKLDEEEIVGPMVQYAKIQRPAAKKSKFMNIFSAFRTHAITGRSSGR
ncbi:hypothetical protein LTR66_006110 [Elasticomyces elasticus]|nr:hypothetical protein LTR66_006110 [Elasticomyces elasticus]